MRRAWDPGEGAPYLGMVSLALGQMQSALSSWDKDEFWCVKRKLRKLRSELEKERSSTLYKGPTGRERRLMSQLSELVAMEEIMEKQRSRVQWLHEGDRNTEFFQAKAKARARTNRIRALQRDDGSMVTNQRQLEEMAIEFYRDLFTAQEVLQPARVCQHVPRKVTPAMNDSLDHPFT